MLLCTFIPERYGYIWLSQIYISHQHLFKEGLVKLSKGSEITRIVFKAIE